MSSRVRVPRVGPVLAGAAAAAFWVALAWWRPTTTWHLGPLLVAAAPGLASASDGQTREDRPDRVAVMRRLAVTGALAAAALSVVLAAAGLLEGPTVVGLGPALPEALAVSAVGGLVSWHLQTRQQRLARRAAARDVGGDVPGQAPDRTAQARDDAR